MSDGGGASWGAGGSREDAADSVVLAELVNADKAAGRARKYKIIFSPQKVRLAGVGGWEQAAGNVG